MRKEGSKYFSASSSASSSSPVTRGHSCSSSSSSIRRTERASNEGASNGVCKATRRGIGDEVARLHESLSKRGFAVSAEEIKRKFFGPATRAAVIEIQKRLGLDATGKIDERRRPRCR